MTWAIKGDALVRRDRAQGTNGEACSMIACNGLVALVRTESGTRRCLFLSELHRGRPDAQDLGDW